MIKPHPSWDRLLKVAQEIDPAAHIAGGAVRDYLLGKTIRDHDLFTTASTVGLVSHTLFPYQAPDNYEGPEYFVAFPDIAASIEFSDIRNGRVNIIGLNSPYGMRSNVNRFNFGLNRVGYDGKEFYITPEFVRDLQNKTFTLRGGLTTEQLRLNIEKWEFFLQSKYPDYRLVLPPEYETTVDEEIPF